jgi:monovalent cation:proton antiporter-2 (CPA2) family protein
MEILLQLVIIIVGTKFAGDLAVRLGQPAVLGTLLVGILLGPAVLGWVQNSEIIEALSYIGVLLLMFFAGLETDVHELNANRNASISVALGGIILPFLGGYAAGIVSGMEVKEAMFIGLLLSATSVSISVQTFKELGLLKSRESTTVLGAALVDDIIVVILLAVLMSFLAAGDVNLGLLIGKKVLFFAVIAIAGWKLVPYLMRRLASVKTPEPVIKAGIVLCFVFAWFAEWLGVAGVIGAFAAGVAIAQTGYRPEVEHKLEPIAYTIFVPVFFVSIGLSVSFDGLAEHLWFTVALCILAVVTKWLGAGLGAKWSGFSNRSSLVIGAGMVSRGEIALIIAAIGLSSGLLAQQFFTAVVIVIVVSTVVTPPLIRWLTKK